MSGDLPVSVPVRAPSVEVVLTPEVDQLPPAAAVPPLSPEQSAVNEAVFTQQAQEHERQQVAGIIGMWTGTLLLHDLAVEHFEGREDEEEKPAKPRLHPDEDDAE
jgi:hypothetical protein